MKVLHILYRLMPSGAEKMLADSAEMFRSANVEGEILVNDSEEGVFAPTLKKCGYPVHVIPYNAAGLHLLKFWRICRAERYDAVHIHVIRGFAGFALAARLAGVKHVVKTFHSVFKPVGVLRAFRQRVARQIAKMSGVRFVSISKSVQRNETEYFSNRTELIWNWADDARFVLADASVGATVRQELEIPHNAFVLLSVGNCHSAGHMAIKNHGQILRALALLSPDIRMNTIYLHVGAEMKGEPERKLADELGVSDRVRFLGLRNDVWRLLSCANEYLMTSLHEGIPISGIEAALSGRHMILTQVPGLVDYEDILPDVSYVGVGNAQGLASVIVRRYHRRGAESGDVSIRNAALRAFSMNVGVKAYCGLYGIK